MTQTTDLKKLDQAAKNILIQNDRGGYTVPTPGLYPYQWNWDSAFVALGFVTFDLDRGWQEIETLFEGQWEDGLLPQIIFRVDEPTYFPGPSVWQTGKTPATSGISQPPVAATIIRTLYERSGDRTRLEALYPKVRAWHDWFDRYRDPERKGLVLTTHPWETGRDNSPEWDMPAANVDTSRVEPYVRKDLGHVDSDMRPKQEDYDRYVALVQFGRETGWDHQKIAEEGPFQVWDVGMSFMLIRANRDLLALAEVLGETEDAAVLKERLARAEKGIEALWNEDVGAYCSQDRKTGRSSGLCTSTSFLAFYANIGGKERRAKLIATFDRIAAEVEVMVPSTDPKSEAFDSKRYWRGPVWAVVNYMISEGLEEQGFKDQSKRVREDTMRAITQSGFYEAFDPVSTEGTGGSDFSWTAAIWLYWSQQKQGAGFLS